MESFVQNNPLVPPHVALIANIETMRQVLAAIVSRLSPDDAKLVETALEQGTASLSSAKAAETDLQDNHLLAHVDARNDFRRMVKNYRTMPPQTEQSI